MGKIIVVRHGVTELNQAQIFQPHDTPLADLGVQQARTLGERLKDFKVVRVLTSDLKRTKQTTENLLKAFSQKVEVIEHSILREREFGDLKGTAFSEVDPELFHPKSKFQPRNGENWETFHARVQQAWEWILSHANSVLKGPEDVLVVVTHGLVKSSLASRVWGMKDRVVFDNTSVSIVTASPPHRILELNNTSHLTDLQSKL